MADLSALSGVPARRRKPPRLPVNELNPPRWKSWRRSKPKVSVVDVDIHPLQGCHDYGQANGHEGGDNHQRADTGTAHGLSW